MFWNVATAILSVFRNYTVQIFAGAMLFCVHIRRREFFWPKFAAALVLLGLECWIFDYKVFGQLDLWGWFNPSFLVIFATVLFMLRFCFECDWRQSLFIGSVCWELQHLLASTLRAFDTLLPDDVPSDGAWNTLVCFTHILISAAVFTAFHFVFIRSLLRHGGVSGFANLRNNHLIILSLVSIVIVYLVSLGSAASGKDIWHLVYAVCCCLLLLFLQFGIFIYGMDLKREEVMRDLLEYEHEQHELSRQSMELLNHKCHDIKHEIADLRKLVSSEIIDARLGELQTAVRLYDSSLKTGNSTLDVLLTEKLLYCEKYGICFTCIADGSRMGFMSEEDIYSLFCNALDNAIESVEKADGPLRYIGLNVRTRKEMLVVHIDNYCDGGDKMVFVDGLPQTTKPNNLYHGYGMLGIRYITEKYGGVMSVTIKDNTFTLNIVIPLP